MIDQKKCLCGSAKSYVECCGRVHQNRINAKTAEDLMRARYVAYALADGDFLMDSHHPIKRQMDRKAELVKRAKSITWLRLEILSTSLGGENDDEGFVEFKAYFKQGPAKNVQHEKSKFVREFGQWVYWGVAD